MTYVARVLIPLCFCWSWRPQPFSPSPLTVVGWPPPFPPALSVTLRRKRRNSRQLTTSQAGSVSFAPSTLSHFRFCRRLRQPFSRLSCLPCFFQLHRHSDAPLEPPRRLTHLPLRFSPSDRTTSSPRPSPDILQPPPRPRPLPVTQT